MKNVLFEQKKINYKVNGILLKMKDYAACFKNAGNFLVA
jgi:hypothetical protein